MAARPACRVYPRRPFGLVSAFALLPALGSPVCSHALGLCLPGLRRHTAAAFLRPSRGPSWTSAPASSGRPSTPFGLRSEGLDGPVQLLPLCNKQLHDLVSHSSH